MFPPAYVPHDKKRQVSLVLSHNASNSLVINSPKAFVLK